MDMNDCKIMHINVCALFLIRNILLVNKYFFYVTNPFDSYRNKILAQAKVWSFILPINMIEICVMRSTNVKILDDIKLYKLRFRTW